MELYYLKFNNSQLNKMGFVYIGYLVNFTVASWLPNSKLPMWHIEPCNPASSSFPSTHHTSRICVKENRRKVEGLARRFCKQEVVRKILSRRWIHEFRWHKISIWFAAWETIIASDCASPRYLLTTLWAFDGQFSSEHYLNAFWTNLFSSGLSGKSQVLFALVFSTRYLDLVLTFISVYNTVMKVIYLVCAYGTVYLMLVKFKATYDSNHDTFRIEFLLIPVAGLACLVNHEFSVLEVSNFCVSVHNCLGFICNYNLVAWVWLIKPCCLKVSFPISI